MRKTKPFWETGVNPVTMLPPPKHTPSILLDTKYHDGYPVLHSRQLQNQISIQNPEKTY